MPAATNWSVNVLPMEPPPDAFPHVAPRTKPTCMFWYFETWKLWRSVGAVMSLPSNDCPNLGSGGVPVPSSAVTRITHGLPSEPVEALPNGEGGLPVELYVTPCRYLMVPEAVSYEGRISCVVPPVQ
jgi:hypothetical protein